jgi:ATP-dependent RNA helicase DOB1
MTGDVTISPNASVMVMTTEILRSMLYRGSEMLNEVAWVVFDEVHYMRDKERGVVWEETMILLPNSVRYVFLSATIPNALEFASWIAGLKGQPVHVIYTEYRPTPLQQYIFPYGGDGIHLIIDEKGQFKEENFKKALSIRGKKANKQDTFKIVKMIMDRNYQPAIVFSFSKKECEDKAMQMSKLDFNDEEEKALVEEVFRNAIDSLSEDDKKLPQVEHMLPLLKRGIGIHHSGLLPIIKEVVEILFQEGLCKALFSTETFSLGLNMPARTVVFTDLEKFDGETSRIVTSGEYIQMSGRAGRRGIDDKGIVIMMLNGNIDQSDVRNLFTGKADPLNSSFRLSYYMVLNLLRVEEITPEYIMERSFHQHQISKSKPSLEKRLVDLINKNDSIVIESPEISSYFKLQEQIDQIRSELKEFTNKPIHALPYMQPGRLVYIKDGADDWGWGVVISFTKKKSTAKIPVAEDCILDVLLECEPIEGNFGKPKPKKNGEMVVIPVQLNLVEKISSVRIFVEKNIKSQESRNGIKLRIDEISKRFDGVIPVLDPIKDMGVKDKILITKIHKIQELEESLRAHSLYKKDIAPLMENFILKRDLDNEIAELKLKIKTIGQVVLVEELKKRMRVLRRLECTNAENVIQLKGRVACEISSAHELVITEMIFNGVFNDLPSEICLALCSCVVYDEKDKKEGKLPDELLAPYKLLQESARRVAKVSLECKLAVDVDEFVAGFSSSLMEVTYAWAKGAKFYEICKLTDTFEGSIVRMMRRLEEMMRQIAVAAKSIGDTKLEEKFLEAITLLKRDIVFSSSLYL